MSYEQCTSLQGMAEDYSQTSFSDTNQLSLLSGMPTPAKSSENEQQTDGSPVCECGKGTCDCSIHPSTPETWTAYMRDSLAKTLALLESRQAYLREPDQVFTEKSCASLAWYDQSSCSWKTYQQSLVTDWEPYSETWPRWGMTANGCAFVHPMSELRISETDGFYLPTPTTFDTRTDQMTGGATVYTDKNGLPRRKTANGSASMGLARLVQMWPTPTATDYKGSPTPTATARRLEQSSRGVRLPEEITRRGDIGRLNPTWVEWLMGFPIGFTVSKDWVTPKSRSKRQQPIDCLGVANA